MHLKAAFSSEITNLLFILIVFSYEMKVPEDLNQDFESCIKQDNLFAQRNRKCVVAIGPSGKCMGSHAYLFLEIWAAVHDYIPNKEGVSGPCNDMALKNYSKVWNASKTKLIWNLKHLKAAWCYYDNIRQALCWLFYFQTGVKLRGWMKGVYVSWGLSIFKIATEPWCVDRYKQRKLDIGHCHDSVP